MQEILAGAGTHPKENCKVGFHRSLRRPKYSLSGLGQRFDWKVLGTRTLRLNKPRVKFLPLAALVRASAPTFRGCGGEHIFTDSSEQTVSHNLTDEAKCESL